MSTFEKYVGVGTALGIVFGAVFGQAIFGGVGVGVAIGMIFGTAIGAALGRLSRPTVVLLGNGRHLRGGVGTGRGEEGQQVTHGSRGPVSPDLEEGASLPTLVVHADWGSNPGKRWMCVAELNDTKTYRVKEPEPVGDCETLLKRLIQRVPGEAVLVGFDFPIGLPAAYAELAGVQRFPDVLAELGQGRWADFYEVAREASEISIERPFYPHNPGKSKGERKQEHLLSGLGIDSMNDLLRTCERGTAARGPASSLFWTVGAKQVGKAAIIGWRDILGPAIRDPTMDVALWPFDGPLSVLVATSAVTIAETYPAEACVHLGMTPPGRGWSKTSQSGRKQQRDALLAWCRDRPVTITPNLHELFTTGFGPSTAAEDLFDATIGLLSMLEVVLEDRGGGTPDDLTVRNVEGWILGQE